jgi:hypothetical protein
MMNLGNIITTQTGSLNIRSYEIEMKDDFKEITSYIDFAFQIMGIDLTYQDFKNMSDDDKKTFLRDIKINKLL